MKTFLWTTLFWIVAAIAWLLCLGFGNLWTKVLDNEWIVSFLPNNIQPQSCESAVASALESVDWCAEAETNNCYQKDEESEVDVDVEDENSLEKALETIMDNQQIIFNYLQEWFTSTNQAINNIQVNNSQEIEEPEIDENAQRKLEIQSQMEELQAQYSALQTEMASL